MSRLLLLSDRGSRRCGDVIPGVAPASPARAFGRSLDLQA